MTHLWSGTPWSGPVGPGVLSTDRLREAWRARSLLAGWSLPEDWWAPAVEAVADAVCEGKGLAKACLRLGGARGRAGVGIGETLDDLGALFGVLRWPDPPLSLVRCTAEGWVDSGLVGMAAESCEDPLTGLVTLAYLRSRLAEIYRAGAAAGVPVAETHCLVMVDLSDGSAPWRRLARAVVVAHDLRAFFRGGETLTLVGTGRAAALVAAGPQLEFQTAALRRLLNRTLGVDRAAPRGGPGSRPGEHAWLGPVDESLGREDVLVWIERLPESASEAMALLDALAR